MDAKFGMVGENVHSVIFTSDTKPRTTTKSFCHVQRRSLQRSQLIVFFCVFILAFSRSADFLYFGVISSIFQGFSFTYFRVFSIFSKPLKNNVSDSICFNFTTKLFREILIMTEMHDSINY